MSNLFDVHDQVRRLREIVSYLRDAAARDGEKVRNALGPPAEMNVRRKWAELTSDLRQFLVEVEGWAPQGNAGHGHADDVTDAMVAELIARFRPRGTIH